MSVERPSNRLKTGFKLLDKALGGGLTIGSTILLAGGRGFGKTTLALQSAIRPMLYASGEQQDSDLSLSAKRVLASRKGLKFLGYESDAEKVAALAEKTRPAMVVVDSLQTAYLKEIKRNVGSRAQIEAVARYFADFATRTGIAVLLISHVNRAGEAAVTQSVLHLVDTVLYLAFDGDDDAAQVFRTVLVDKDRYGAAPAECTFKLTYKGFIETPLRRR